MLRLKRKSLEEKTEEALQTLRNNLKKFYEKDEQIYMQLRFLNENTEEDAEEFKSRLYSIKSEITTSAYFYLRFDSFSAQKEAAKIQIQKLERELEVKSNSSPLYKKASKKEINMIKIGLDSQREKYRYIEALEELLSGEGAISRIEDMNQKVLEKIFLINSLHEELEIILRFNKRKEDEDALERYDRVGDKMLEVAKDL